MDHGYISDNNGIHEFPKNFILFILRKTGKYFKTLRIFLPKFKF